MAVTNISGSPKALLLRAFTSINTIKSTDSAIIRGLKFYLSEQATVDFGAQTILKGKTRYFVNPNYEKEKSTTWKTIYRAGKEVNTVVKTFVTDWLKKGVHRF